MKTLNKLLLINWHYFAHEMLEFSTINFLTGKNASGKTTIIDSLQLLLLGDTTGHFFNKSASDKSNRSLKGYLRCEIGDEDSGSGQYLRNGRFSNYIASEFYDDNQNQNFIVGIAFDSFDDGSCDFKFFYLNDALPKNHFIQNNIPMSLKELRVYFSNNYTPNDYAFFETNSSYRDFIKSKFGNLPSNFFSLFKKAIPFTPINNIETFITEYVCDIKSSINIDEMQENIRNYKKLELESLELEKRATLLGEINTQFQEWKEEENSVQSQKYLLQRSQLYIKSRQFETTSNNIIDLSNEIEDKKNILAHCEVKIKECRDQKDRLTEEKFNNDSYKANAALLERQVKVKNDIEKLRLKISFIKKNLKEYKEQWEDCLYGIANDLSITNEKIIESAKLLITKLQFLDIQEDQIDHIKETDFINLQQTFASFKKEINDELGSLKNEYMNFLNEENAFTQEINSLRLGQKSYDPRLLKLKSILESTLSTRYNKKINVFILADLLEIKEERWRKAIEGYLGQQRFYLFVDPEYVDDALKIYDESKKEHSLYDFGIVDTEKIIEKVSKPQLHALSEEVYTTNKYARAFIDGVLGFLIKCDRVEDLRKNSRSITDSGMIYQNFVARQLNFERVVPYIGTDALVKQVESKKEKILQLKIALKSLNITIQTLNNASTLESFNSNEIRNIITSIQEVIILPNLLTEEVMIKEKLNNAGSNYLELITKQIAEIEARINEFEQDKINLTTEIIEAKTKVNQINSVEIPTLQAEVNQLRDNLHSTFDKSWILEHGEPSFVEALSEYKNPLTVYNTYRNQIDQVDSKLKQKFDNLVNLKTRYNIIYKASYDSNSLDNKYYEEEYKTINDLHLVAYKDKIKQAKQNSLKQFREDFLSKLRANFDVVSAQINSLNDALKNSHFGNDSYTFIILPKQDFKSYYEMITDNLLIEPEEGQESLLYEKYGDVIEELFRQITMIDKDLTSEIRSELERNIAIFTDYRSYLKFDLIVTDTAGRKQHLSRTLLKKSGGETQTPFYISVLASFAQIYRVEESKDKNNCIRLIVFDEAFSKMDSERIQESVKLLRNFGLQAILAAPPEKMSDILPLVDNTLCVVRDNYTSYVREYTKLNKVLS